MDIETINRVQTCLSDIGECSGIVDGEWCDERYPWAIKSDCEMFGEYVDG